MNQVMHRGDKAFFQLPNSKTEYKKIRKLMRSSKVRKMMENLLSDDKQSMRFSCRMKDIGGREMGFKNVELRSKLRELASTPIRYRLTGMSLLIDKNNETLAETMMVGLLVAFAIIALLMGWLFRSLPMVLITLVPNVLPLLGIAGVMGFSGIDLKVSTSIIFTIAFGIAVDDTIHYVSKLRVLLRSGRSLPYAMKPSWDINWKSNCCNEYYPH